MKVGEIQLDLDNLTLGEMDAAEQGSGRSFDSLISAGRGTRKLLAVFLHEWNNSDPQPSPRELWQQTSNRRLSDELFSDLPSPPDGILVKSPA